MLLFCVPVVFVGALSLGEFVRIVCAFVVWCCMVRVCVFLCVNVRVRVYMCLCDLSVNYNEVVSVMFFVFVCLCVVFVN